MGWNSCETHWLKATSVPSVIPAATSPDSPRMARPAKYSSRALATDPRMETLGWNSANQLGLSAPTALYRPARPVTLAQSGIVGLAVGDRHSCALRSGGQVSCWGVNLEGELGSGFDQFGGYARNVH